jgi:GNAT superfamily N-acetyltransferase
MSLTIESPSGTDALTDFVLFHDEVYRDRDAHWTSFLPLELPILQGESPFNRGRRVRPFWAREGVKAVARVLAVVDGRYQKLWNEPTLGHVVLFEALPGTRDAVRRLMDEACDWLASHGAASARAGYGLLEFPFVIDAYESLPPPFVRHNPPYYHSLLKDSGYETERGWVDYKIRVRPELVARWESALEAARRSGFTLVPLSRLERGRRDAIFADVWNECFAKHWGYTPFCAEEIELLFTATEATGALETSLLAYQGEEPVGALWVVPDVSATARTAPGRTIREDERLNLLGIAVRAPARGRGVNFALAAYSYLELVRRGQTHVSYTLVLDDNWPSRKTGEKLGGEACGSYLVYRRDFRS